MEIPAFLTWGYILTNGGAVFATVFIVQFLKLPLDKVWKIPTQYVVYFIALILLAVANFFVGKLNLEMFALIVFNSFIVAWSAMGLYENAVAKPEEKRILAEMIKSQQEYEAQFPVEETPVG